MRLLLELVLTAGVVLRSVNALDLDIEGFPIFKTEPTFTPMQFNITDYTSNRDLLAPGYIFLAPRVSAIGWGPQIYDQEGNLVWYGQPLVHQWHGEYTAATDLRPCDYLGDLGQHLCWSESHHGTANDPINMNRVFDNKYHFVQEYSKVGEFRHSNPHEFNMLPGGRSFMQVVFRNVDMDLRWCYGPNNGIVTDGCIQEVDTETGELIFNWCFLDHRPVWETNTFPDYKENKVNQTASRGGKGTIKSPWDFAHINAADKNIEGDYLLSARHMDQIMKIAGLDNRQGLAPGTIIWRLGGNTATIKTAEDGQFMRQHHARFHSLNGSEETISFFNNAWGGDEEVEATDDYSSGMLMTVNNRTNTSHVVHDWKAPHGERGYAMGGVQLLPNGNAHVGWGSYPALSEFTNDGQLLYHANFLPNEHQSSYRAYKFPWVGMPDTEPKVVAYCQSCAKGAEAPLTAYVSWNGATEVMQWRFYTSRQGRLGPWIPAGTFPKDGFETKIALLHYFVPLVSVEALDADGSVIGSTVVNTFVPNGTIIAQCDEDGCVKPEHFNYADEISHWNRCESSLIYAVYVLIFVVIGFEATTSLCNGFLRATAMRSAIRRYQPLRTG